MDKSNLTHFFRRLNELWVGVNVLIMPDGVIIFDGLAINPQGIILDGILDLFGDREIMIELNFRYFS